MAFNSISDLNLYSLGSLEFTTEVEYIQPEGTKVQLRQPTWRWVQTTGNVLGNNVTITHETVDTLAGNVTISFDDYNAATMNTNIVNTAGNIAIDGLNNAEDWTGATMYLDVPDDYYGNIEFTSTARNNVSNVQLQWTTVVQWTNEPELSTPSTFYYNYNDQYSNQWSIDFWFYNDTTAPTSSSITSYPVEMRPGTSNSQWGDDYASTYVSAANWSEVISYYEDGYIYPGFDQVLFDFRRDPLSAGQNEHNYKWYFVVNNGPDYNGANTGISYRIMFDDNQNSESDLTDDVSTILVSNGPGAVGIADRQDWTHFLISFQPNIISSLETAGRFHIYRNGNYTNSSTSLYFEPSPWVTLGRNAVSDDQYLEGYLEDFRIRGRTTNEYFPGYDILGTENFTPPTTTTQPSEGDWLLLNTGDVSVLTFDDNNYTDRDPVTLTTVSGISAYSTTEVKNTASIPFNGSSYVFVNDLRPNTYDSIQLMGTNYVARVLDSENPDGEYTLNAVTGNVNLKLQVSSTLPNVTLTTLSGNETNDITLTGTKQDINATLETMYFIRQGDLNFADRAGNITWTLTPPNSRAQTVLTQAYRPLYVTGLTGDDRVYMRNSVGPSQLYTLAYVGVDNSANPVYNYLVWDEGMYDGSLTSTNFKIEYLTGNLSLGAIEVIETPDPVEPAGGRIAVVGPRQHINLGNTVNDNTDVAFIANEYGGGNIFVGNISIDCNNMIVSDYGVTTVTDTSGDTDGTDPVYIAQIPTGVANTWYEGPWSYEKNINIVEAYSGYEYTAPSAVAREDETEVVYIADSNKFPGGVYGNTSPQIVTTWQNLDSASTANGGKKKLITATKTHTFGPGVDTVDLDLQAQLALKVEDDSDIDTNYITNITESEPGGYYLFNDTVTNHYLSIDDDRFYKVASPTITFSGNSVDYDPLYILPSTNFNITIYATMASAVLGQRLILTNSPDESFGTTEFALVQRGTGTGPQEFRLFIGGSFIPTSASFSIGTKYKINIIRVGSTITLYVDDVAVGSTTVTYTGAIGTSSATTWYHTEYSTGTPRTFDGTIEDLYVDVAGSYVLFWDITTSAYDTYTNNNIEFNFRFMPLDTSADQYVLSNMADPTATLTAGDWRLTLIDGLHGPGVSPGFKLETYNASGSGSFSMTYGNWYNVRVERVDDTWSVYVDSTLDLDFTDSAAIGATDQTTIYFGNYTNSTDYFSAYLDNFSAVDDVGTITSSDFTSVGYESRLGPITTLTRTDLGGDAFQAVALVYGGSDDRAYLIYTKAQLDGSNNVVYTDRKSKGLFYRKLSISDDLNITVGSEVEIVSASLGLIHGWMLAADAIKLGSNMFINIVVSAAQATESFSKAKVYAVKFAYS